MFKKSFKILYEENESYPSYERIMIAISKYCNKKNEFCIFVGEDEVEINGKRYAIYRKAKKESRGISFIKCVEI